MKDVTRLHEKINAELELLDSCVLPTDTEIVYCSQIDSKKKKSQSKDQAYQNQ